MKNRCQDAEDHYKLGITHKLNGRLEDAEASFRYAIALQFDLPEVHHNLGTVLYEMGLLNEAVICFNEALSLRSDFSEAYYNLGITQMELGEEKLARENLNQATLLKKNYGSAEHMLAAFSGKTTETAPSDYVEQLFDNYAANFEHSLVKNLEYKMPKILVRKILKDNKFSPLGSVIDLGCGTGLLGLEVKDYCRSLVGVDLSSQMLDEARKKNIYRNLYKRDITDYLKKECLDFDYFILMDVLIYIGDFSNILALIKSRNNRAGKLVFTTEHTNQSNFLLKKSGRYSHSKQYIIKLCQEFNYHLRHFELVKLRKQNNKWIEGGLYILDIIQNQKKAESSKIKPALI